MMYEKNKSFKKLQLYNFNIIPRLSLLSVGVIEF